MINFTILNHRANLGWIPAFLSPDDPRPAREQFDERYAHGGGWRPMKEWHVGDANLPTIQYPGDPALQPVAFTHFRDELICIYPHAWVGIFQLDGTFEVSRMD
jgi:hypothetical protein